MFDILLSFSGIEEYVIDKSQGIPLEGSRSISPVSARTDRSTYLAIWTYLI